MSMSDVWRSRDRRDAGLTLIELLITMILMAVVSSLVVAAVIQSTRILTHTQDEDTGLQDAKVVLDRVGRDIRESRGVVCIPDTSVAADGDPTCRSHLQLWVDSNSDYVQQPTEVVTWLLKPDPDSVHSDVWRVLGTGAGGSPVTRHLQASSLIVNAVFTYDTPSPTNAERVDITLHYDSIVGRGSGERTVNFSARIRNKG